MVNGDRIMGDVVTGNFENGETLDEMLSRLAAAAEKMYEAIAREIATDGQVDMRQMIMTTAGLAGYACHQAVLAGNEQQVKVETDSGKCFYFGDAVNRYVFENKTSIFSFVKSLTKMTVEQAVSIDAHVSKFVGTKYVRVMGLFPEKAYGYIKACWEGLFEQAIEKSCKSYEEWPVLMGVLLQNVLYKAIEAGAPAKDVSMMAMESAIVLSKMDDDSI